MIKRHSFTPFCYLVASMKEKASPFSTAEGYREPQWEKTHALRN